MSTNGVSAGTQVAASKSTAVRLTVLTPLEQAVKISHFFVSWCNRARNATCPILPRTPIPNCLASRLIFSSLDCHCRMVPAARRRLHVIPKQTAQHCSPKAAMLG